MLRFALGVALGAYLTKKIISARRHTILRLRLKLFGGTFNLANARVPLALLPPSTRNQLPAADAEGLVACDVRVANGKIASVTQTTSSGLGWILTACWADSHTHLVKTQAHGRTRNPTGSISDALASEVLDQPRWAACPCCRPIAFKGGGECGDVDKSCVPCPKADDIIRRMDFSIACAYHHGTRAIRTHLDGCNAPDAKLRATVYAAFAACRKKWAAKGMVVQGVANLFLPLWAVNDIAAPHLKEAVQYEGVLLGAYCGNVATTPEAETVVAFDCLFAAARKHNLAVDLHIDETNEPRCCALKPLVISLKKARANGYTQPVLLGHCTALALQPPRIKDEVIRGLAGIKNVTVVCNPHTNLGLMDRRGSEAPHCVTIDYDVPRTPIWRGLTLVQELNAAGVPVGAGSDNVRDWWCAYGTDYDGLQTWKGAVVMGQLDTAPSEGAWAHVVSDVPAAAMGVPPSESGYSFAIGAPADLILFPDVRTMSELMTRPHQPDRIILRKGRVQESTLPSFEELDDLIKNRLALSKPDLAERSGVVQRGGAKLAMNSK